MKVNESIARDILRLFVWYPLRWLILFLPPRTGIFLLALMGDLHFTMASGKRLLLAKNLSRMRIPKKRHLREIRRYFQNHYIDRLLIFIFPKLTLPDAMKLVEINGLDHLKKALEKNKGAVLVHGHFGPVHLPLVVLSLSGFGMQQIGNPTDHGLSRIGRQVAFRLRLFYEAKIPAAIVKADGFLRPVFRHLKKNNVLMITGDGTGTSQRIGRHEAFCFFGHRALFPLGPATLAKRTGAALLPMFVQPGKKRPYRIVIEPSLDTGKSEKEITQAYVRRLESRIRQTPGFMHFLDRFESGQFLLEESGRVGS